VSCPHGPLVGGYVLGALDPREMEEMRLHVAGCPHCGPEARALAGLPELLDRIEPADVPPPALPPEVEEAVLDRFARERRAKPPRRSRWAALRLPSRGIAAAAAACAVALVVALVLAWPSGDGEGGGGNTAYASVSLEALAPALPGAGASAELAAVPEGTEVQLRAWKLRDAEYELWCIRGDGRWVSGGTFWAGGDGRAEAELMAAVRPGDYHTMVVTRSAGGGERGPEILRGELRY